MLTDMSNKWTKVHKCYLNTPKECALTTNKSTSQLTEIKTALQRGDVPSTFRGNSVSHMKIGDFGQQPPTLIFIINLSFYNQALIKL